MRPSVRSVAAALACAAGLFTLTGCLEEDGPQAVPPPAPGTSAEPTAAPVAEPPGPNLAQNSALTPRDLAATAVQQLEASRSYRITGTGGSSDGPVRWTATVAGGSILVDLTMPMGGQNTRIEMIIVAGREYIRTEGRTWANKGPGAAELLGGKWVVAPADLAKNLRTLTRIDKTISMSAPMNRLPDETRAGRTVLVVQDAGNQILKIDAYSVPTPVLFEGRDAQGQPVSLSFDWGNYEPVSAPPNPLTPDF